MLTSHSEICAERVLVLDGAQRAALAVTRSLGERGISVIVADTSTRNISAASRFCVERVVHTSPLEHADAFAGEIANLAQRHAITSILPITDVSTMLLVAHRRMFAPARLCAPDTDAYHAVTDKAALVELAARLEVPIPRTVVASSRDEIREAASRIGYPVVVKPSRSRFIHDHSILSTSVKIARTTSELEHVLDRANWIGRLPALIQEFVPGHGAGVFTVYGGQGPLAWFAHRRIREMPPSGGVSVLCESDSVNVQLKQHSERMLNAVGWFGPAMIEYRIGPGNRPYLMEINGRFWGSLQLSIDCGVDFPWLLLRASRGEDEIGPRSYPIGKRLRWLLRDVDNLVVQLRDPRIPARRKLRVLADFALSGLDMRSRQELLRWHDVRPAIRELALWFGSLSFLGRARSR